MKDKNAAFINLALVIVWRADDDVVKTIAVDIAGAGHGEAELGTLLVPLRTPGRGW